jgi:hypothetical protein
MSTIVCGLNIGLRSEDEKTQKKSILIDYLIRHLNVSQTELRTMEAFVVVKLNVFTKPIFFIKTKILTFVSLIIYSNITCTPFVTGFVKFYASLISSSKCLSWIGSLKEISGLMD